MKTLLTYIMKKLCTSTYILQVYLFIQLLYMNTTFKDSTAKFLKTGDNLLKIKINQIFKQNKYTLFKFFFSIDYSKYQHNMLK